MLVSEGSELAGEARAFLCFSSLLLVVGNSPSLSLSCITLREGFLGLRNCVLPVMVPPVPTPPMRMSILPSVWSQISGPVVSRCTFGLSGLLNCCSMYPSSPRAVRMSSAFFTAPPIPFEAGVSTRSEPNALSSTRRSMDMDSGMVRTMS